MRRIPLAVALLLSCQCLPTTATIAAEEPFPVSGEWFACHDKVCFALDITESFVKSPEGIMCADVITTHVEENLALVNCIASGKSMEMFFLFHAEDSATLWFSGDRPMMTALRRSKTPMPEKLLGEWVLEEWPQRSAKDSLQMQLKQNVARLNGGQREQVCEVIPLATEVPGGQNLFLECGRGEGIHLTLKEVPSGTYITTGDSRRGVGVLYRKNRRPSWLPSDYGQHRPDIREKAQAAAEGVSPADSQAVANRGHSGRGDTPLPAKEDRGLRPRQESPAAAPRLLLKGREEYEVRGKSFTRYRLTIENHEVFPNEMFRAAPDLPPCGLNKNSSRTWVDIFSSDGRRLYGFCAFTSAVHLTQLWFAVDKDSAPPEGVYVVLDDRETGVNYKSNTLIINTYGP